VTTPAPTPTRWLQIKALFEAVVDLPAAQREAPMAAAGLDATDINELRSLLAHHDEATGARAFMRESAASQLTEANSVGAAHTGQRLGAWEIVRAVGTGGMGEVFEARRADGSYEGRAAVKLLKRGMDSSAVLRRFAQERQALARLSHPHIARLLDAGASEQGLPYFVLEFVDGQPIDVAVRGLTLEARLRLFLQLADAVAHAHRNLLVHRDLKPGNVLVDTEGHVKLLDFGIAKALDPLEGNDGNTTVGGQRPYTPNYASPEQVRGEPVSTATDIYSLGVLLYQMLTGVRPTGRHATTPAEAARCVLEDQPTKPSRLTADEAVDPQWLSTRKKLEGDLDNILLKALVKQPNERYPSVDAMAGDIKAYLEGRPVSARAASAAYVARKFVQRHWIGSVLASLALVAVMSSAAYAAWQAQRAEARFKDLRQLAHSVLFDYHDLVEAMVGATPVRKRLVTDALTYLDRLGQHAPSDRAIRREMGVAYRTVGLVQRNGYRRPHLGDTAGALSSYERAITLLEALAKEDPDDPDTAYELALALSARAGVWGEDGDLAAARPALLRAASLFEQNLARDTPDLLHRLELARTHLRLASVLAGSLDYPGAKAATADASRTLDSMAALQPHHQELPHVWVWVQGLTAQIARGQGEWAVVVTEKMKSQDILLRLLAAEPDNARYLEDLAGNARWLLSATGPLRDVAGAERWGNEACERSADLVRRDPDDRIMRGNYLDVLISSGSQLVLAGAPERGRERLQTVRAPLMAAVTRWRDDPEIRAREILLLVADGLAEAALRKDDAAKVRFDEAAALAASLNVQFPNQPMLQTNAAVVAFNSAKLLAEQALRIDSGGSQGGASARATARAAVEAALTELEALLRRKALVPSARASNIEEARALLRRLGA
jgi:eukaryotic-like serine/threonine-protein kinase